MTPTEFWVPFNLPLDAHMDRSLLQQSILQQMKFALELPFDHLPRYISHNDETVRIVISERLKGKTQQGEPTVEIRYFPFSKTNSFLCKF